MGALELEGLTIEQKTPFHPAGFPFTAQAVFLIRDGRTIR